MSVKYLTYFTICSSLAVFLPCGYIKIWNFCNKFLKNKIIKAIFLGLITPLLSFAFAYTSVFSLIYLLFIDGVAVDENTGGAVLFLLLFLYGIPISILLGIAVTIFILMENTAFKDEVIRSLKKDARNFFNDSHSEKKK